MNQKTPANQPAFSVNNKSVSAQRFQAVACDPQRHVVVEACAGSGKTWILVSRIIRALLAGTQPHEILAITFTKKAAAEMRQRLNEWLSDFAQQSDTELLDALQQRGMGAEAAHSQVDNLHHLYVQLLRHGRTVQIRTFHSWFGNLLRAAPLHIVQQLGLPTQYTVLEDDSQALEKLWQPFYAAILADAQLLEDYQHTVAQYDVSKTQEALKNVFNSRSEFTYADAHGVVEQSIPHFAKYNSKMAGLAEPLDYIFGHQTNTNTLHNAAKELGKGNATEQKAANAVIIALENTDWNGLWLALFTAAGTRRKLDKKEQCPSLEAAFDILETIQQAQLQHIAWQHQQRMVRLSRVLLDVYKQLKQSQSWVDMHDMEQAAHTLLADESHSAWLHERLDAQIKHLLVDEFQDTNPIQWQTLHSWLQSYAGDATAPKVFLVGDPKQSIYRFRRADPKTFIAAAQFVHDGLQGDLLHCDHTRRCSQAIVDVLNPTFNQAEEYLGFAGFRAHTTENTNIGKVLALPQIPYPRKEKTEKETEQAPTARNKLTTPKEMPAVDQTEQECAQAAAYLQQCLRAGMPASEILVLARTNKQLNAMRDALNDYGITCQMNEKNTLADAPEVQDIVALIDVLVSPQHNISLARALKSPIFLANDADLVDMVCAMRSASPDTPIAWLPWLLQQTHSDVQQWQKWADTLQRWQQWVQQLPTHDALDKILRNGNILERYASYTPSSQRHAAVQHVQALPKQALDFDGGRYPNAYNWVRAMRTGENINTHAQHKPDAIQLLTIHGAKGLQASLVLLLDTDKSSSRAQNMPVLLDWQGNETHPKQFIFADTAKNLAPSARHLYDSEQAAQAREELNALYVAITRAKSVLVLSSTEPYRANDTSWWQLMHHACTEETIAVEGETMPQLDTTVRTICQQFAQHDATSTTSANTDAYPLPTLAPLPKPLQRAEHETRALIQANMQATLGKAMHSALEWHQTKQPTNLATLQQALANQYQLSPEQAQQAIARAHTILNGQAAWAWDEAQLLWHANEVEIVWQGEIKRIDRLVLRKAHANEPDCWWVLDYKSSTQPNAQDKLTQQLHTYRQAIQALHPQAAVRAAFLTADGCCVEIV